MLPEGVRRAVDDLVAQLLAVGEKTSLPAPMSAIVDRIVDIAENPPPPAELREQLNAAARDLVARDSFSLPRPPATCPGVSDPGVGDGVLPWISIGRYFIRLP